MEISALQAFIAVAEQQSFSRASETLFITQSAISKRIAALEDELGLPLFNRVNRQISLTEAGKQLLPKAQELIDQTEDMRRFATNLVSDISGDLKIGASHHVSLYRLPPILSDFATQFSNVDLDIRFGESDVLCAEVERGAIELALVTLPSNLAPNLSAEVLWRDPLRIVVSSNHVLADLQSVKPTRLAKFAAVLPTPETETHKIAARAFAQNNLSLAVQMATNNLETLKMLVKSGLGWSLLPESMVVDDSELDSLELDDPNWRNFERQLGCITHRKRSLSNPAKAMQELVRSASI